VAVGGLPASKVRRVIAFIENNLQQELRLEELAAVTHMSPYHFARLFKRATGVSPHRFVVHRRIDAATALLIESHRSADRVHHFHRLDRARSGAQDRESFRRDGSAHHRQDAERASSAQSRRRAASRDASRRRRASRQDASDPTKVG